MTEVNKNIQQKTPTLIRVSSTIILVMGIIGLLFFATTSIYLYYNPEFLHNISNTNNIGHASYLSWYIIIQVLLHISLIISALLIIKQKKTGLYLFLFVFIALLANGFIFDNELILNYLTVGLIILFTIVLYYRKFK